MRANGLAQGRRRQRGPGERTRVGQPRQERHGPEGREQRGHREPAQRLDETGAPPRHAQRGQHDERDRGGQMRRMRQHDRRGQRHERAGREGARAVAPRQKGCRDQREQAPRQARRRHADMDAALDAAGQHGPQRQRQGDEGPGQREPAAGQPRREREPRRHARCQVGEPQQRVVRRLDRQRPERDGVQQRPRVREGRRVELQLRIAGPPAFVPRPRRGAVRDDVPETVELARMIVEGRRCQARASPRRTRARTPAGRARG